MADACNSFRLEYLRNHETEVMLCFKGIRNNNNIKLSTFVLQHICALNADRIDSSLVIVSSLIEDFFYRMGLSIEFLAGKFA